jgi:hypothetical protein
MEKLMDEILQLLIVTAILNNASYAFPQCHKANVGTVPQSRPQIVVTIFQQIDAL